MNTFFRSLILSLTRPSYYHDILQARPSFSIKYYLVLSLLLTTINTIGGIFNYAPAIQRDFSQVAQEIVKKFPPSLVIDITPQGITANKPFPLVAQTPTVFRQNQDRPTLPQNLLVIDPRGEINMLKQHDSLMLLNNSYLIINEGENVQTMPLKDLPTTRIDLGTMQQLSTVARFISNYAFPLTGLAFLISSTLNFLVLRVVYLIVFSFGIWLIYKSTLGIFSNGFKIGVHTFTLPILISTALGMAGISLPIPGWFTIIHAGFALYVLSRLEKVTNLQTKR